MCAKTKAFFSKIKWLQYFPLQEMYSVILHKVLQQDKHLTAQIFSPRNYFVRYLEMYSIIA